MKESISEFFRVGAHQNSQAENDIQTIMYTMQTFMLHVSLHWSEHGVHDLALLPFAVKHVTCCTIMYLEKQEDSLQLYFSKRFMMIIKIFSELMTRVVLPLC